MEDRGPRLCGPTGIVATVTEGSFKQMLNGAFGSVLPEACERDEDRSSHSAHLRVISWNLLRLVGANVDDVAAIIERHRPDLFLMQEATRDLDALPRLVGGHLMHEPLDGRVYGLVAWSPQPFSFHHALRLPASTMPGRVPPRVAQIFHYRGINFANVHLSHGQLLNRRQLLHIGRALEGPSAIIGDYNAVGPIVLTGFKDIGPRRSTVSAGNVISLRVDRCMARGLRCSRAQVLDRGPSDHHPIFVDLRVALEEMSLDDRAVGTLPTLPGAGRTPAALRD